MRSLDLIKCLRCKDCKYFFYDGEYYSAFEDNCFLDVYCEKEHYDRVRFGAEPCEDFEEDVEHV